VVFAYLDDGFLAPSNVQSMLANASQYLIIAVGVSFTILARGIDVSVGSIAAIASVAGALASVALESAVAGIVTACAVGALVGLTNGVAIAALGLSPLIVTLASLGICRGLALLTTQGRPISNLPDGSLTLGNSAVGLIPVQAIVAVLIFAAGAVLLHTTRWGAQLYAVGANPRAATTSGVNVKGITASTYVISGVLAGLVGAILTSRLGIGSPLVGNQLEFVVLPMVFLGGVAFMSGRGTLIGVFFAVVLLTISLNGMLLVGVEPFWQQALTGGVLVAALIVQRIAQRAE
jgi:putative xylitol transport system permease protein